MNNREQQGIDRRKTFNRDRYDKKPDGKSSDGRKLQPQDDNVQPGKETNQPRNDKFQPRDSNFLKGESRFQNRVEKTGSPRSFIPRNKNTKTWKNVPSPPRVYSEMQITDGKHRGKFLQNTVSPKALLTAQKLREGLFRLIFRRVRAARFLDLYAGSGAIGIEAISRGALLGTFVERSAKMCGFIKKNLETCGIKAGHGEIIEAEVVPFLKKIEKRRRFWDVVFLDPPYDVNYEEILEFLKRGVCVKPGGALVIKHHEKMFFPERLGVLKRWRVIVGEESAMSLYERK